MSTTFRVDFKWSLWLAYPEEWEEYAKEAIEALRALTPGQSVKIITAPKKEIRAGCVTVSRDEQGFHAEGAFSAEWDDVADLADTLGLLEGKPDEEHDDVIDALNESLPHTDNGDPGITRTFKVQAADLETLLSKVDEEEGKLLDEADEAWQRVEKTHEKAKN